jgi:hypothetical protein
VSEQKQVAVGTPEIDALVAFIEHMLLQKPVETPLSEKSLTLCGFGREPNRVVSGVIYRLKAANYNVWRENPDVIHFMKRRGC